MTRAKLKKKINQKKIKNKINNNHKNGDQIRTKNKLNNIFYILTKGNK